MIKPQRLKKGDKVAIVSLSAGTLGEKWAIHRYYIAKERFWFKSSCYGKYVEGY